MCETVITKSIIIYNEDILIIPFSKEYKGSKEINGIFNIN